MVGSFIGAFLTYNIGSFFTYNIGSFLIISPILNPFKALRVGLSLSFRVLGFVFLLGFIFLLGFTFYPPFKTLYFSGYSIICPNYNILINFTSFFLP